MTRKFLAILSAILIAASLCACGNTEEETTVDNTIDIGIETPTEKESDTNEYGSEITTNQTSQIGDPGEYEYEDRDEAVYVNNPGSAVTLRSESYEALGSVAHGTELVRKGVSKDVDGYWSKVEYEGKACYVATKFLTTMKDPDEGFEEVEKIVRINEATGSLNVRNIPSMEGTVIGHVQTGKDISVIAENVTTGWYKITFVDAAGENKEGYIASNTEYFVAEETEAASAEVTEAATEAPTSAAE